MHSGLFVEAGRRAHVILRQDGTFSDERERSTEIVNPPGGGSEGIWIEPWRVADGLEVVLDEQPLEQLAIGYERQDGVSTIEHRIRQGLRLAKRIWVPMQLPAVVIELELRNDGREPVLLTLLCATRLRLSLGWPLGTSEPPTLSASGDVLRAANSLGQAAIACNPPPAAWSIDGDRVSWTVQLRCQPGATTRLRVAVAAGTASREPSWRATHPAGPAASQTRVSPARRVMRAAGAADPSDIARKALRRADDLLRLRVEYYRRCALSSPRLATPDPTLDRAFAACLPALEDFKHHDPAIGLGYLAGFPAYNFYFAGDAFRMLYGACVLGDWSDMREALRTIIRGQRLEDDDAGQLVGELWHELSTTGHQISPNFVTLELPSMLVHYARWSADLEFVRETLPAALRAGEWAARKDTNADGLPDNGPEQTFADGVREDLNVAGAHITPAVWQLRACVALAELCTLVGETSRARAWRRRAARTRRLVESTFWDPEQASFVETIRPDGMADTGPGFVPSFEVHDDLDPALREDSLQLELEEERALQSGRSGAAASFPAEARQARAYYVMDRGDRARRLLQAGWADEGAAALKSIARLPFASTQAGFFPEIASRSEAVADPRGCFHQGWTAGYGLAYPVVAGLWGLRPDAVRGQLQVAPTPPSDWDNMRLDGLRVGQAELNLAWRRLPNGHGAELVIEHRGGASLEVEAWLACPIDAPRLRVALEPDRRARRARRRHDSGTDRIGVRLTLAAGEQARVPARWAPPRPSAAAAARSRNVRHTGTGDGTIGRSVRHIGARDGTPQVVYLGFLAPPFSSLDLRHVPLNYAVRRPEALLNVLPTARAVVITDQQDAPLSEPVARALASYVVEQGGSLLFFCAWSSAWGRGFFDTYCSIAQSSIPDLLPLAFRRSTIRTTTRLRLEGPGRELWADLPWADAPAIDYQPADLRPGALVWARAEAPGNDLLAASWTLGAGRVVAIGLDAFGFGHGTFVHWPGQRLLLRRALDWLLGGSR